MRKIIILLLLITVFFSCSKNDKKELNVNNPFLHIWSLNLVTGGLFTPETYDNNDITFEFKEDNTVSINFNITIPSSSNLPFHKDTVVSYQYESNKLQLDEMEYTYTVNDEYLTLNNSLEYDGILLQFRR